jgi:predicted DNA-binding transcriptional regulator YafY
MSMSDMTPDLRAGIDRADRAAESRVRLSLAYADAGGARATQPVRPLGLWFWGKVWTLIAWCELRNDFGMFRLDRIEAIDQGARFASEHGRDLIACYQMMEARHSPGRRDA